MMGLNSNDLVITFLNVGQGDCAIVDLPDGTFGLIDFGPGGAESQVLEEVGKRLELKRAFRFAAVTHFDSDHVGNLEAVMDLSEPETLVLPCAATTSVESIIRVLGGEDDMPQMARVRRLPLLSRLPLTPGLPFPICSNGQGVMLFALSPTVDADDEDVAFAVKHRGSGVSPSVLRKFKSSKRRNRSSAALYLQFGAGGILFLGEIEKRQILSSWDVVKRRIKQCWFDPVVVKLSHHGAKLNNPTEVFRYFCFPGGVAVASAGANHGHPDVVVLNQLAARQVSPVCTNLGHGCKLIIEDGNRPEHIEVWRKKQWSKIRHPYGGVELCHGNVRITLHSSGSAVVHTESIRMNCPFGAIKEEEFEIRLHREHRDVPFRTQ